VVEFIGVTGVGKSTLVAAVERYLSDQGARVVIAEDAILAHYGLGRIGSRRLRSAAIQALSLPAFARYFFSREGASLIRLARDSITSGMGSLGMGARLARNFSKRVGSHLLLEELRDSLERYDVVIWDEGIVHAAHNLFVHTGIAPCCEDIARFASMVPKPDQLVWVTAPPAQSINVLLGRGHTRVPAEAGAARDFVQHAAMTFGVLAGVPGLQERIIEVDNSFPDAEQGPASIRARARYIGEYLLERSTQPQQWVLPWKPQAAPAGASVQTA
jgi:hypothetical protein